MWLYKNATLHCGYVHVTCFCPLPGLKGHGIPAILTSPHPAPSNSPSPKALMNYIKLIENVVPEDTCPFLSLLSFVRPSEKVFLTALTLDPLAQPPSSRKSVFFSRAHHAPCSSNDFPDRANPSLRWNSCTNSHSDKTCSMLFQ